jgi:WD40 repeat protein
LAIKKELKFSGRGGDPMLRRKTSLVVAVLLGFSFAALWWLTLTAAAKPAKPGPKGVDLYGDLLPPGAVARLGTIRLRIPYFNSALVFSRDGKFFVTGGGDENAVIHGLGWNDPEEGKHGKPGGIRFWDAETGKELRRFDARSRFVRALALTPDDKLLASCGGGKEVHLRNTANGETARIFPTEHQAAFVCFSPDGKTLAATTIRNTVHLWEVETGRPIRTISITDKIYNQISRLCFSPDGKVLAGACAQKGGVYLWDVGTGEVVQHMHAGKTSFYSLAFSADSKTLAAGGGGDGEDCTVRSFDVKTARELFQTDDSAGPAMGLRFSDDGKTLTAIGWEGVSFHDAQHGKLVRRLWKEKKRLQGPVTLSPDGKTCAWTFYQGLHLVDLETGRERIELGGSEIHIGWADFSPDGKTIGTSGGKLRLWDLESMREKPIESNDAVSCAAFTPDQQTIVVASFGQTLALRDTNTGKDLRKFVGTPGEVECLRFLPDSKTVASMCRYLTTRKGNSEVQMADQHIRIWSLATGKEVRKAKVPTGMFGSFALSPDGRLVSTGEVVVNIEKEKEIKLEKGDASFCVAFAADSKRVAAGCTDGTLRLWDAGTGKEVRRFKGFDGFILALAFSRDNRLMASGGTDHVVRVWNIETGEQVGQLTGHRGLIRAVAFSPDGSLLLSGSDDTTVLVWSVPRAPAPKQRDAP